MNTTPDWATSGDELKADPSSLRGFAKNVSTIAANLLADVNGPMMELFVSGSKYPLSTGGLTAGGAAEELTSSNQVSMSTFCGDEYQTLLADGSAFHTLADCYETGANNHGVSLSAIQWVYQEAGGKKPAGANLSHLYDKNGKLQTMDGVFNAAGEGAANDGARGDVKTGGVCMADGTIITTYRTADGGERTVTKTGTEVKEVVTNAKGETIYTMSSLPTGSTTTTFYKDGKPAGTTTTTRTLTTDCPVRGPQTTHEQTTVVQKDANGKVLDERTDHVVTKHNYEENRQTKQLYTTEDGKVDEESRRNIGKQPAPATPDDWQELAETEGERARTRINGL
ncbi:hypothetical protein NLX83_25280 [Allokutzneria sp. A3M-2-11 16]|uniref:hypothetical protein n=1 Tax=Allokutzneria sp. A3M-2-11 16 TaxID=2962043 RepID=UPI0020B827D6|nr:hypothetical protein [Allokutzneria sp. A3M-2-11 16]MCP3802589.1 hypothetical protein [Allokutzneria sp. A3M-2-11 16]